MSHLRDQFGFHRLALEDCLSRVQLPKVDEYDGHVFIVTHFPVYNHQLRIAQPSQVVKGCGLNAAASYSGCIRCNARLQRAVEGDG
jgi:magnesium transporter